MNFFSFELRSERQFMFLLVLQTAMYIYKPSRGPWREGRADGGGQAGARRAWRGGWTVVGGRWAMGKQRRGWMVAGGKQAPGIYMIVMQGPRFLIGVRRPSHL